MYINPVCRFLSYKFTQFYSSCLIVLRFHCADYTDSYRPRFLSHAFLYFLLSACATVRLEVPDPREPPEAAVCPSPPFDLFLAGSVWYFLYFLVFFSMVVTSGGWCGTKFDLFCFYTRKSICSFSNY